MIRFALPLIRPYWRWVAILIAAMLIETAMTLAAPWPLTMVLDSDFASFTVGIGQWSAHDLRSAVYAHLRRLSMSYYDKQQVGPLISTITDDIDTVQTLASTSLLDLLVDGLTVVGMLAIMFPLDWRFTLVALAITPPLLIFTIRLRTRVKGATRDVRLRQSEIVSILQEGLGSIRLVEAFAQGAYERRRLDAKSLESVAVALGTAAVL